MREGIRVIGFFFCWQDENKQKNEKNMKEAQNIKIIKKIKNKKCLTSFLKSDMILNVAANNGNTTMTTQKQFEKIYEQRNNFLKRNKKS